MLPARRDDVAQKLLEFIDLNGGQIHNVGGRGDKTATLRAFYKEHPEARAVLKSKLKDFCASYDAIGYRPDESGGVGAAWIYRLGDLAFEQGTPLEPLEKDETVRFRTCHGQI